MNPYKKLLNNSLIFAIGNFGSKIVSLFLVPLYTYHLSTSEYGALDILLTTINMLLPIISLSIYESVLRFIIDKEKDEIMVLSNSIMITFIGSILILFAYPIFKSIKIFEGYLGYMYIILILQAFQYILAQYARAINKLKLFASNGILMTVILGIFNIFLLVFMDYGVEGYLISIIVTNVASIIYLGSVLKIHTKIYICKVNIPICMEMLYYSVPLIPNALLWWTMGASNRYLILYFIDSNANGIFAIAQKIPTLLAVVSSIFSQSWQLSAIEEYKSDNRSDFYSKVFYFYNMVMLLTVSAILVILKFIFNNIIEQEYFMAWEVVPFLLIGSAFNSFSVFIGTNYIASKETKGAFGTTIFGSVTTIVLSVILIPLIGIKGCAISTMISSIFMWIIRLIDTKKYIKMTIDKKSLLISLLLIMIQIVVLNLNLDFLIEFVIEIVLFLILLFKNWSILITAFKVICKKEIINVYKRKNK